MSAVPKFVIRRGASADLPTVLMLLQHYYTEQDIWLRDPPEKIASDLAHPQLGVFITEIEAEIDAKPAGCVLLSPLSTIPSAAECKRLYVAPQFRGHGLADQLMDAAETHAHQAGLDWIYLDSRTEMTAAISLYRRRGYEEIPRFNDNAQATIFLRKRL